MERNGTLGSNCIKSAFVIAVVLAGLLTGCGVTEKNGGASAKKNGAVTFRLGHVAASNDPWQLTSLKFAGLVEKNSKGRIKVQVFGEGQLGDEKELLQSMQVGSGTVDMGIIGAGTISIVDPKINILSLPYLFRDHEHLAKVLYGDVGKEIMEATRQTTGIKTLAYLERGPRHVTNSKRPLRTLEDFAGLKVRIPPEALPMVIWWSLGAEPVPMAFGELYAALQEKTVDGQENPLELIASSRLNEVQQYLALTYHSWAPAVFAMSDKKFSQLSPEDQKILLDAAGESALFQNDLVHKAEDKLIRELEEKGMKVTQPDLGELKEATREVHQKFDSVYGQELYDRIRNVK